MCLVSHLSPDLDLRVLDYLSTVASAHILPFFRKLGQDQIDIKGSPTDFVTIADRRAEYALTTNLTDLLPDSVCVGEEAVASDAGILARLSQPVVWTIDPLDGTRNFVAGRPQFCSMVGLLIGGVSVKSWIYRPLCDDALIARKGEGVIYVDSHRQIRPCAARFTDAPFADLRGTINASGFDKAFQTRLKTRLQDMKGRYYLGSAGLEAMNIALGDADYLLHSKLTAWDNVPVDLICRELGYHVALAPSNTPFHARAEGALIGSQHACTMARHGSFYVG